MTTERRAASKLVAPTINLASVVYGLDAYMRLRGANAGDALRRVGLERFAGTARRDRAIAP